MIPGSSGGEHYEFGTFRMSVTERVLRREGQIVPLTPKCFDTLLALARNGGSVVAKEQLMRAVWPDAFVEDGNLTQNIFTLRKTLGELPQGGQYIETIPKRGYRLVLPALSREPDPVETPAPEPSFESRKAASPVPGLRSRPGRVPYFLSAFLLIALTLAVGRWILPPKERQAPMARITPLAIPNNVAYGVISPDGSRVAYVSYDDGGQSLWLRETNELGLGTRLAGTLGGHFWGVAFTRGGESVYYVYEDDAYPVQGALFRIPSHGAMAEKLIEHVGGVAISPVGDRLLMKRCNPRDVCSLVMASATGSEVKVIARSQAAYAFYNYQWSADGRNIYYAEGVREAAGESWALRELPLDGGLNKTVLDLKPMRLRSVIWLNQSEIVALSPDEQTGISQIWNLATGRAARRLTNGTVDYSSLTATADGQTLLANSRETHDSIWTAGAPDQSRSAATRLPLPVGSYNDPVWTPDGHVVYVYQSNLWVGSENGVERRPLLPEKTVVSQPVVLPDGRYVLFVRHRSGEFSLWRIGLDGTGLRQVTSGPYDVHPAISPDGKWVVYERDSQGQIAVCKVRPEGGTPVQLTKSGGSDIQVSPDSSTFAEASDLGAIEIRTLAEGALVETLQAPPYAHEIHWSPDGRSVLFTAEGKGPKQFWSQSLAGGPAAPVGDPLPSDAIDVAWSKDGRNIVYLRREIDVGISLITNFR